MCEYNIYYGYKVKEKKVIMITINAIGDTCPIPVVKTKKAIEKLEKPDTVETLVDNEIAVENLKKMASQMGFAVSDSKINSGYSVKITVEDIDKINDNKMSVTNAKATSEAKANSIKTGADDMVSCNIKNSGEKVVVIKSEFMGDGDNELGKVLIKGFIYALSQQDELPQTMLFYNGGAKITSEGSESIEDLKALEEKGVKIFTCGTCLNYYGLTEKLCVGEATNMYEITKKMTEASLIVAHNIMYENCKRERHTQLVISFKNTTAAMEMESRAKSENIYGRIIPLPSKISAGCGLAWKTEPDMRNETINFMQKEKIQWDAVYELDLF